MFFAGQEVSADRRTSDFTRYRGICDGHSANFKVIFRGDEQLSQITS